ncbi:TetR/AcrR family transcriptional regulator [Siphonobacter sp. SORGH_AS_1065]|uniref:TetR/AcrR family transcriptional regulator n=1 Tax=Siphonobacter sp. SORGH_AS_1065 TaxID=3041795 RepID=UPI00277DB2BA|nr:TetR/AcrR family transcriptional regulator [Siphonobacter sp. SORGH_AS_1065]MDQ1089409.1 AcrR family transcriptional regulator [Siphonobacter sp. SORGH_AS_1065]
MTVPLLKDEQIKASIMEAAQKIFQQYGLNKTTMEDIAKAMGKGKSTLYYYFASKEEIFEAVLFKEMSDVFTLMEKACEQATTTREKFKAVTHTKIIALHKKMNLYRTLSAEVQCNRSVIDSCRNLFSSREINLFEGIITFGIERKEIHERHRADLSSLSHVILSALRGIEIDILMFDENPDLDTKLDLMIDILGKGLE